MDMRYVLKCLWVKTRTPIVLCLIAFTQIYCSGSKTISGYSFVHNMTVERDFTEDAVSAQITASWSADDPQITSVGVVVGTDPSALDCEQPIMTVARTVTSATISHLRANTTYTVGVCVHRPDENAEPVIASVKTFPVCDMSVTADGTDFIGLQAAINSIQNIDPNGDGIKTICLGNTEIINDSSSTQPGITLSTNDYFIYAPRNARATLRNQRSSATVTHAMALGATSGIGSLTLENVNLITEGANTAFGLYLASGAHIHLKNVDVTTSGTNSPGVKITSAPENASFSHVQVTTNGVCSGSHRGAMDLTGTISVIDNTEIVAEGNDCEGIHLDHATVATLYKVNVDHQGDSSKGLRLNTSHVDALISTNIRSGGAQSLGLSLMGDSSVSGISGLKIIRANNAIGDAVAISAYTAGGPSNYFDSTAIQYVTVCTEVGAAQRWEQHSSCSGDAGVCGLLADTDDETSWAAPVNHAQYSNGTHFGAQTFPFNDLTTPTQDLLGITLGGWCP